jgi:hypothetical protein
VQEGGACNGKRNQEIKEKKNMRERKGKKEKIEE